MTDPRVAYWMQRIRECDAADHLLYVTVEEKAELDALMLDVPESVPIVVAGSK